MDFPPSSSVFYIDDDHEDERIQYFDTSRAFHHQQQASTSYEMLHRAEKKRKLNNHHLPSAMPVVHGHGPKRPRNQPFDQGRIDGHHGIQSGTEFEPILLDPEDYVIEEPETHSFHAFDWTLDQRRAAATNNTVTVRKPPHVPLRAPPPPPPPMPTISMIDTPTNLNLRQNSIDRNEIRRRSSPMDQPLSQQQRKILPIPVGLSSAGALPLPLPKPTAALPRAPARRGRPAKVVRPHRPLEPSPPAPPARSALESAVLSTPPPARPVGTIPPIHQPHSEIRRQTLNGTGIFSAFHDTKYYRCNICKFKSVTSSTLLQHLFTHLFFCQQCSYYTFSNHQLAQHLFDKHQLNFLEDNSQPSNPSSYDLLYLTRCADGTFALCMDASASPSTPSATPTPEPSQPSSSTFNQLKSVPTKKRKISRPEEPTLTIAVESQLSLAESTTSQSLEPTTVKKSPMKFILMKNRAFYSLRKPTCLHGLTLEYEICRRETLAKKLHCSKVEQRKLTRRIDQPRRLIEEIAHCLRTVVNQIVWEEENEVVDRSAFFTLPEQILGSIFPTDDLKQLTNALKLTPKSNKIDESREMPSINAFENHIFVLGISETIRDEEVIRSTLHSNVTNGEMPYTQTKLPKLPLHCDNTFRFFRSPIHNRGRGNSKKLVPKAKTPSPPQVSPATTVMSNSTINLSSATHRVDRNNNSITSSQSKGSANSPPTDSPHVIVLD